MRTLDGLLLLADFLAFYFLVLARTRNSVPMVVAPVIAFAMAAAHMLVEGPRWQMVPAYGLAILFFLLWLVRKFASSGALAGGTRPRLVTGLAIGAGALGLTIAAALPVMVPSLGLAQPSGPYAIGTMTYHWVDLSRSETFGTNPTGRRQLMAQIWYPALANPAVARAAYLADAGPVATAFARIHGKPALLFRHFKFVTTNAMPLAPTADDQTPYPVLLFLDGATGYRQMNTFQVEHLVSHGYIVVAIDQPGAAAMVVFPDGHQLTGLAPAQFRATVGPSYLPGATSLSHCHNSVLLPNGRMLHERSIISYLAQDASFALDQLAVLNRADPNGILTGKLNLQRIGTFGVSLGGIVAGQACQMDQRLRACLMMDAPMPTGVVKAGLQQPSMWITRDAASMRLERQRSGGWPEAEIEAHQNSMRAVYDGLSGAGYLVRVPGMFHSNFTDIFNWTALTFELGLSGPIDGRDAHAMINAYSLAFFDRHLLGRTTTLLDGPAKRYPGVLFESRQP